MSISPARSAAFDILFRTEHERAFSSILLAEYEQRLTPRDRALCHHLTLGVLRRQIYLDRAIAFFTKEKKIDLAVRISLRMGIFQLFFLDRVPAHSAVNESVNLVQRSRKGSARGFVNAVLRRAEREGFSPVYADDLERVEVETSHPRWLLDKWSDDLGPDTAALIAEANNSPPSIAFRSTARALSGTVFQEAVPSDFVPGCLIAAKRTAEMASAAERGEIYFQDEGSQLVGHAVRIATGGKFLDVCAAPGSKATQIAMNAPSSLCVAGDLHSHRTRYLLANVRSQGISNIGVVGYDAERDLPFAEASFDTVLVDAPCSGTGTIRHNPEIRYFLKPADFAELSAKQRRILKNASKMVRPGGVLVYSTCSIEREENEAVADSFLFEESGFKKVDPAVPGRFMNPEGYARTLPHRDEMDGFFIATFERNGH